ncbi:MAG: DUF5723 family protein [Bacteroidales bacterium]|nr:DUF5723 family protein [Bacteroidales bacterium]
MTRKIKYILIMLLTFIAFDSAAQNSQVLYYMNLPQRHLLNPAIRPTNSVYIGLPAISGINLNVNNNFVNFSDVIMKSPSGDSLITILHPQYDIKKFIAKFKDVNSIEPEALFQLFGLGFNAGKDLYIFLDINERVDANIAIPGDLFRLAFEGNEQFAGNKIDLSTFRGDVKYYREAGLGFSKNFSDKLRLGIKGKLLFGVAAASIDNRSFDITVNDDYTHTINADLNVNFSAPLNVTLTGQNNIDDFEIDDSVFDDTDKTIDFVLGTKNMGLGLDIGAEYSFSDRLKVSAAITDLGYIKWKRDITTLKAESQFTLSGIDLLEVYKGNMTFDSLGQELLDSLKASFFLTDEAQPSFTTNLPFGVTFGGSYNLTKSISIGILSYTKVIGKQLKEALTLSANINLGNALSTTFAYTAANSRYDNLGAGLALRAGWFQFYVLADRIPVTWNKIVSDSNTIPLPESWNTIHVRFGMNFAFGNKIKKKDDKPMVLVQ